LELIEVSRGTAADRRALVPRFHFHLHDGLIDRDEIGRELPTLEAARREAVKYLADYMTDNQASLWADGAMRLEVESGNGMSLFTLHLVHIDAPATRILRKPN
jgi:hypothetical protein